MSTHVEVSPATLRTTVQQYFAATRSPNKVEDMLACFAKDAISRDPAEGPALNGHSELRQFFQGLSDLFAEVGLTEEFISINGNQVAVKWIGKGTGQNGRAITFAGIDLFEVNSDSLIQSMWGYWNPAAMIADLQGAE